MAIRIDATNEILYRTANLPAQYGDWTICVWMKATKRSSAYNYAVALENGTYQADKYIVLGWASNGTWEFTAQYGAGATYWYPSEPSAEQWTFVALVANGDGVRGYQLRLGSDSSLATNLFMGYSIGFTPAMLSIGSDSWDEYMNAAFAHAKVWDAALTQAELEREMWSARPVRTANLNLWSPFIVDDNDHSGNGRDWTQNSGPGYEDGPPVGWGSGVHRVQRVVAGGPAVVDGSATLPSLAELIASGTLPATPIESYGTRPWSMIWRPSRI